jgi:TolB-like protein
VAEERVQRRLAAIFVADVVGYSRLMGADEEGTRARLRLLHAEVIEPKISADGGRIVKTTGDGILVEFPSAVDAVRNALDIQGAVRRRNTDVAEENRIEFRVGINVGDVIVEGDDIHGDGVNVASRLEGLCGPGEVYVSGTVYDQAAGKLAAAFEDLGEQTVKNIAKPVRVYRTRAQSAETAYTVDTTEPLPLPDKPSIAVLPFTNMSGEPDQEYFADGIAEDIITSLSRLSGFFVIARNSTFTYKGQAIDVKAVARELGVRYVLEGSVRKAANRVRVTAQLIDGESGNHVWAERYDRELADIFAVQDEITETIVGALAPKLHVAEITRSQHKVPSSLGAWDLVMQAIDRLSRFTVTDSREAIALLDRAIVLDPGYARAYAHKAWLTIWRAFQGWDPMGEALVSANDSVTKGRQFDADEPWVYVARTMVCMATLEGSEAVAAARKAVELNPNFAYGYSFLGVALATSGDGKAAISAIDRAVRLSPRDLLRDEFELFYAFAHFQMGNYAEAADFASSAISLRPGHAYPYRVLAASSALSGEQKRAEAAIEEILALTPGLNIAAATMQTVYAPDDDRERFIDGLRKAGLPE